MGWSKILRLFSCLISDEIRQHPEWDGRRSSGSSPVSSLMRFDNTLNGMVEEPPGFSPVSSLMRFDNTLNGMVEEPPALLLSHL
jgi:hypothetical protein